MFYNVIIGNVRQLPALNTIVNLNQGGGGPILSFNILTCTTVACLRPPNRMMLPEARTR